MADRRQLRVSEAREGRSERPALGAWALPEPLPTGMPGLAARASNSGINRQKIPTRTEYAGLPSGADQMPCSTDSRWAPQET